MSELESIPPDEEKKPINSFYDATSFHLNGDLFENQVKSLSWQFLDLSFLNFGYKDFRPWL